MVAMYIAIPSLNQQASEEKEFSSVWIAEDYFYGGAFSTAAACAVQTSKIQIGIGVINPFTRHPVLSAMGKCLSGCAFQRPHPF